MLPVRSGMHEGMLIVRPVLPETNHCVDFPELHPQPTAPPGSLPRWLGFWPQKCSMDADPSTRCPAQEGVARHAFAKLAEHAGDPDRFLDDRHVAVLAALLLAEVAREPLLVGHLFRKRADFPAVGTKRFGDEGVAGGAELGLPDVFALGWTIPG